MFDSFIEMPKVKFVETDQFKIDLQNERQLTKYQREYRFSSSGIPLDEGKSRAQKKKQKLDRKKIDVKDKNLEVHLRHDGTYMNEMEIALKVAYGFPHSQEENRNMEMVAEYLNHQEKMNKEIIIVRKYIQDLRSQLDRLAQDEQDLAATTESEDKYYLHLKRANRQLEIYENKAEHSCQKEGMLMTNNQRLLEKIEGMLHDRALFNCYWSKMAKNLNNSQKFLIDMIERTKFAFNQSEELCLKLDSQKTRSVREKNAHIQNLLNMKRRIDADTIYQDFLRVKGQHRQLFKLEPREVKRRNQFKEDYSNKLNLYHAIIEKVLELTDTTNLNKAMEYYNNEDNIYFQHYNYLNEMNNQIEYLSSSYNKLQHKIDSTRDYTDRKLKYFDEKIDNLNDMLQRETESSLNLKDEKDQYEQEIGQYLDTVTDILKLMECDLSPLEKKLGDYKKVTIFNLDEFLSALEDKANESLAFIYCNQRKDDLLLESKDLVVRSMKRKEKSMILIHHVVTVQQCAECAEGQDVNRYDDRVVLPFDFSTIKDIVRDKVEAPEMVYRLHNISNCRLPRSRTIVNRRYL